MCLEFAPFRDGETLFHKPTLGSKSHLGLFEVSSLRELKKKMNQIKTELELENNHWLVH